jgi:NAD(P)-dependent dehydrogenase (short-subunit alcohol dehydrogenase family)
MPVGGVIRPVTEYPEDVFDQVIAVNLKGSFLACKYALPKMRDGGSIVMTSSVVGVTSDPGIVAYAASKHGLIGLMRTVAKEAASRRIRVNVVAPGPIDNSFQRDIEKGLTAALGTDGGKFLDSVIPLHRHATAEEVAESVLFLASERSAFTTGTVLMADGGMHV